MLPLLGGACMPIHMDELIVVRGQKIRRGHGDSKNEFLPGGRKEIRNMVVSVSSATAYAWGLGLVAM